MFHDLSVAWLAYPVLVLIIGLVFFGWYEDIKNALKGEA